MAKTLEAKYINPKSGNRAIFKYINADNFDDLDIERVNQVYGICFLENKMVIVKSELTWKLPGGTREPGESIEDVLLREIVEETNMKVTEWKPIGVQTVLEGGKKPYLQLRIACKVKPVGDFKSDPGGDVTEIKVIDPNNYKHYFDWGEIGEEIINRAKTLFEII